MKFVILLALIGLPLLSSAEKKAEEQTQVIDQRKGALQAVENLPTVDKEELRKVVLEHKKAIKGCYDIELIKNPKLEGKLVLQWEIVEDGKAEKVSAVMNETKSEELVKCIGEEMKMWTFPEPPKGQVVRMKYPFQFNWDVTKTSVNTKNLDKTSKPDTTNKKDDPNKKSQP